MFGPTNIDEVFFQATYIEAGKTSVGVSVELSSRKEDKRKWNGKKENSMVRKEEKPSCNN
jgi:acyl-CoA hydrolase